jgi:enediyne biosynthesis thioesterase
MPTTLELERHSSDIQSAFLSHHYLQRPQKKKVFHYRVDICLKDSNAYGNTYFARYFEWQGVCRERWFYECIAPDMLQSLGVFITKDAHQEYVHETFPFERVDCEVTAFAVKQCSFSLRFRFFVGDRLVSTGYQQIVFATRDKKITRLPEDILDKIRQYEDEERCASLGVVKSLLPSYASRGDGLR